LGKLVPSETFALIPPSLPMLPTIQEENTTSPTLAALNEHHGEPDDTTRFVQELATLKASVAEMKKQKLNSHSFFKLRDCDVPTLKQNS
jgi:hypothetical protein